MLGLDMKSIACTDIPEQAMNQMLLQHLAGADFFLTSKYPEATVAITSTQPIADATFGSPNYSVVGTLTLRGNTQPIQFPALIALTKEGELRCPG